MGLTVPFSQFLERHPDVWIRPPGDLRHWYGVPALQAVLPREHLGHEVVVMRLPGGDDGHLFLFGTTIAYRWVRDQPHPTRFRARPWPFPPLAERVTSGNVLSAGGRREQVERSADRQSSPTATTMTGPSGHP